MANKQDHAWCTIVDSQYYVNRNLWEADHSTPGLSAFWKGIVNSARLILKNSSVVLGQGNSISFWIDRWCHELSLQSSFPDLYDLAVNRNHGILQLGAWSGDVWFWDVKFRRNLTEKVVDNWEILLSLILPFNPRQRKDHRIWKRSSDGEYSAKSGYM